MSIGAIASSYLAQGHPRLLVVCVVGATGAAARCFFCYFFCFVRQFGGFLVFLAFCPFFRFCSFLGPVLCPQALVAWGGIAAGGGLCRVGSLCGVRECLGGPSLFPVLPFVTVGRWVIGRPRNGSEEVCLSCLCIACWGFLVLTLLTVHSAQRQQGRGLRVLGTNCSLHESEFRLCPEVVLDWFPRFADQRCARLADS